MRSERGQAAILLVGILLAVVIGGLFLGIYARAVGVRGDQQRAVDLAARAGARSMRDAYPRVFELGPGRLSRAQYEELGRRTAIETAARNRAPGAVVDFPRADGFAPVLIRVRVMGTAKLPAGQPARVTPLAEAELVPDSASFGQGGPGPREDRGPRSPGSPAARWRRARTILCARTSRSLSTAWPRPPAPTGSA